MRHPFWQKYPIWHNLCQGGECVNEHTPSYYAVIPAPIRSDDGIPANAKLLYGEISALIGPEGFCYATNAYFAGLYKLSERTVSGLISSLQEHNYIVVQVERDKAGKVERRKILLTASAAEGHPVEEIFYTPRKYFREGIENIFQYTNTSNTVIEGEKENSAAPAADSKPPADRLKVQAVFSEWLDGVGADWSPDARQAVEQAFAGLVELRQKLKTCTQIQEDIPRIREQAHQYRAGPVEEKIRKSKRTTKGR